MSQIQQRDRLFVGSLADETSEQQLKELFAQVDAVVEVSVMRDWNTGRSRGFGFVQMTSEEAAQRAIELLHGQPLNGRKMRVVVAEPRGKVRDKSAEASPGETPETPGAEAHHTETDTDPLTATDLHVTTDSPADARREQAQEAPPLSAAPVTGSAPVKRRWISPIALAFVVLSMLVGGWLLTTRRGPSPRTAVAILDASTVMVAPLKVLGQQDKVSYAGLAFAQALSVNLAVAQGIKVIPVLPNHSDEPNSASALILRAKKQGVGRLVQGTLTRHGNALHVAINLVASDDGHLLWGTQIKGTDSEVMSLAAELAGQLASHLGAAISRQHAYVTDLTGQHGLGSDTAFTAALGALRRGEIEAALAATATLIARAPAQPEAIVLRTHALTLAWDAEPTVSKKEALLQSMRRLDASTLATPYGVFYRAFVAFKEQRTEDSIGLLTQVLDRQPLAPAARAWMLRYRGVAHQVRGEINKALADLDESLRLDPTNAWTLGMLSSALVDAGRIDEAITRAKQGLALVPSYWRSHQALAYALAAEGKRELAAQAYGRACELARVQLPCALQVVTLQKAGLHDLALAAADKANRMTATALGQYNLACFWALRGKPKHALDVLEKSVELGLIYTDVSRDPDLASLRDQARFKALLQFGDELKENRDPRDKERP